MNEWIETAGGRRIERAYVVKMGMDSIAIYAGTIRSIREALEIFGEPEGIRRIHSWQFGDEADWDGFTTVTAMQANEDGAVICLRKG